MIYELENFLDENECNKYVQEINNNQHQTPFTNAGKFSNNKINNFQSALLFYEKLLNYGICDNILRPNNVIMTGKYSENDIFDLHTDTGLFYDKKMQEETRWTLLIYLNNDFSGGETIFYDDKWNVSKTIKPVAGKAILFDIDLWHKGSQVFDGHKYWIGCEIIGKFKNNSTIIPAN
jgi:predicted 2-oxoglutarate/Fe(II)-dependent dioxygenase YbiX